MGVGPIASPEPPPDSGAQGPGAGPEALFSLGARFDINVKVEYPKPKRIVFLQSAILVLFWFLLVFENLHFFDLSTGDRLRTLWRHIFLPPVIAVLKVAHHPAPWQSHLNSIPAALGLNIGTSECNFGVNNLSFGAALAILSATLAQQC